MAVCTMARARALMVGPVFRARMAARVCSLQRSTALSSARPVASSGYSGPGPSGRAGSGSRIFDADLRLDVGGGGRDHGADRATTSEDQDESTGHGAPLEVRTAVR